MCIRDRYGHVERVTDDLWPKSLLNGVPRRRRKTDALKRSWKADIYKEVYSKENGTTESRARDNSSYSLHALIHESIVL